VDFASTQEHGRHMTAPQRVSLIITTYNWPAALDRILHSLERQVGDFEVLIADDGSTAQTKALIESWQKRAAFPLHHIWQEDDGFRAGQIRNKAVAAATGDYLIFIDGDCIPAKHFIATHVHLAQPHCFVAGQRILLSEAYTQCILSQAKDVSHHHRWFWFRQRLRAHCNRWLPMVRLPGHQWRHSKPWRWRGVKTCHLALWKCDFLAVNGFDERYHGWGYEDSDLVLRLLAQGVRHKSGRYAVPVLHLYHQEVSRDNERDNWSKLQQQIQSKRTRADVGVDQYISEAKKNAGIANSHSGW